MKAGRAADVWSLGCALFLVTMHGTKAGVRRMYGEDGLMGRSTNLNSNATTDYFYRKEDKSTQELSGDLNPHVRAWLDTYDKSPGNDYANPLLTLIKEMLTVDPNKRITTSDFLDEFQVVIEGLRERENNEPQKQLATSPFKPKTIWTPDEREEDIIRQRGGTG